MIRQQNSEDQVDALNEEISSLIRTLQLILSQHFCSISNNPLGWGYQRPAFLAQVQTLKERTTDGMKRQLQAIESSMQMIDTLAIERQRDLRL
jgi:hypothetical protein